VLLTVGQARRLARTSSRWRSCADRGEGDTPSVEGFSAMCGRGELMNRMIGTDRRGLKAADPLPRVGKALPVVGENRPLPHSSRLMLTS
jgi:hypothetical protein